MKYILILVLQSYGSTSVPQPIASVSAEFNGAEACAQAEKAFRQRMYEAVYIRAVCVPKGPEIR